MLPMLTRNLSAWDGDIYCRKLLAVNEHQGYTNQYGKKLVMRYKDYLAQSFGVLVPLIFMCKVLKNFKSSFCDNSAFDFWMEADGGYLMDRIYRILNNIADGLHKQRRVSYRAKDIVKANEVNVYWYRLLRKRLDMNFERLNKIRAIVSEDLKQTPFALYLFYLEEKGTTFDADLIDTISEINSGSIYGLDYEAATDIAKEHIFEILTKRACDKDALKKAQNAAVQSLKAARCRREKREKDKEQKVAEIVDSRISEAEQVIAALDISKELAKERTDNSLHAIFERFNNKYVVCAIRIPETINVSNLAYDSGIVTPKYLYSGPNNLHLTRNARSATKFDSIEEALEKEKELKARKWRYITAIRQLDFTPYLK